MVDQRPIDPVLIGEMFLTAFNVYKQVWVSCTTINCKFVTNPATYGLFVH